MVEDPKVTVSESELIPPKKSIEVLGFKISLLIHNKQAYVNKKELIAYMNHLGIDVSFLS